MNGELLELIKSNMELIKGAPEVEASFPYVGQGKETIPSDGKSLALIASKLGVTARDFSSKVIDPAQVQLSKWNYKQKEDKIRMMVNDPARLKRSPPILVHEKEHGDLECIDGGHRTTAAHRLSLPIKAIIMNDKSYKALDEAGFRDTKMYRLGHYFYDTNQIS